MNDLTVTLTDKEWDIIGNALGLRPYAEVAALIQKLQAAFQKRVSATEPAPE